MLNNEEILKFINEDKTSKKKRNAEIGQRYYEAEHDILNYRMFYFNSDGKLVEDNTRSNIKISHPFFTELVDQGVQYMLSNKDSIIRSDDPELQEKLDEYFDDDFICELNDVLTGTMSKGFEYMYAYMNKEEKLTFECADSLGVVEVSEKDSSDGKEYIIYWYTEKDIKENKVITKVEEWVLTLPIRVAYDLSSRFRLHGGPYVSYVFSHHFSGEAYNGYLRQGDPTGVRIDMGYEPETRGTYDFSSHMRRMQFGVEAGFDWNGYRRWGLAAGVSWGLTGVFKSDFHTIEQTLYPIYGTIGLTYRFK